MRKLFDACLHLHRARVLVISMLLAISLPPHTAALPAAQAPAAVPVTFSTYLGGNGSEVASGVAFDDAGNLYVTGRTRSTNFPVVRAVRSRCMCRLSHASAARHI